jgi:uncharacterized protein involved in exopolysaccharide biosynthesis
VSIIDVVLEVARGRKLLALVAGSFFFVGVLYVALAPEQYTSSARIVREAKDEKSISGGIGSGLSSLQGLGINLGGLGRGVGLTIDAYPEVLKSREVRLAVARDTFRFPDTRSPITYVQYVNRDPGLAELVFDYTLRLPFTLKEMLLAPENGSRMSADTLYPTEEEKKAIDVLNEKVKVSIGKESQLMNVMVTESSPQLAAALAESFLDHLDQRVRHIRTRKARKDLSFIRDQYEEAEANLRRTEERLEEFLSRNASINSPQLRFERNRLQRQVDFASQLYESVQKQLTQSRIDLRKEETVITVVERPVPPLRRSAPKRLFILIVSGFLGVFFGFGAILLRNFLNVQLDQPEEAEKIEEIKNKLVPKNVRE